MASYADSNAEAYSIARQKINHIRQNFKSQDVTQDIFELNQYVHKNGIELERFGFGKGVLPYWRSESSKNIIKSFKKTCESSHTSLNQVEFNQTKDTKLNFTLHGDIQISVVDEPTAQKLFQSVYSIANKLASEEYGNRCESRAHVISRLMEDMCMTTAKAFIESEHIAIKDHTWSWYYHVAPIILVSDGINLTPYIFDHSIFDRAVPLQKWIDVLRQRYPDNNYDLFFTKRFNLLPNDRDLNLNDYSEEDFEEVDKRLLKGRLLNLVRPFIKPL